MNEKDLHEYQWAAVRHIIAHPYCALFLDMGLGKTVSTLTAVRILKDEYLEVSRVLVIAPKRVEKPRDFDPFGQAGLSPLATI